MDDDSSVIPSRFILRRVNEDKARELAEQFIGAVLVYDTEEHYAVADLTPPQLENLFQDHQDIVVQPAPGLTHLDHKI